MQFTQVRHDYHHHIICFISIFQYTEAADPELEPIVSDAMTFLVKGERDGKWPSREKLVFSHNHKANSVHSI